ncbi:UNVERIFIED_CONTAM: Inorganic pyrophosphatase 2 [Sesamum calycinum]|uniref:Inorganic pyrophosphatase 2 n=1 Tax=Sesamum calycinum TaxID=2727403 RepID=A0AAW2QVJ3_9LAMI
MIKEVHAQEKTLEDIKEVLRRVPMHPRVVPAIKKAHALGCDLRIVSDANTLFIETILDHLGIKNCFTEINTNPNYIDDQGRLRISPYVDFHTCPHGCNLCPPNMWHDHREDPSIHSQGREEEDDIFRRWERRFLPEFEAQRRRFHDAEEELSRLDLICENRALLRAEIHEWSNGAELGRILLELIEKISIQESNNSNLPQLLSADCKFESIPMALPPPLRVHQ